MLQKFKFIFIVLIFLKAPYLWGFSNSRTEAYLSQAESKNLAENKGWLRLGHYQKNFLGQWQSIIRGSFFLAPNGHKKPQAELQETLKQFFKPGSEESHAQCRFLARREWIKKNLPIHPDDLLPCTESINWIKNLDATGVSLIFASADTSSASSIYGHTFLKVQRSHNEQDRDLLNYGINYAALATDNEGVLYAIKGLFGYYKGGYTMLPYHEKLREYVNLDGRDIWEYDLNLTQAQVNQLIYHLVELKDSWSPYYFTWNNCSYQLLSLLDVANESLNLADQLKYFVIPLDAVKVVSRSSGLVRHKNLRPSLKKDFSAHYTQLSTKQKQSIKKTIETDSPPIISGFSKHEQIEVLDAAMKFYALKGYQEGKTYQDQKHKLFYTRAQLGLAPTAEPPKADSPDGSHDSSAIYLGAGKSENSNFASFKIRTAFHDLVSPDNGLFEFSQNEILSADLRYYSDQPRLDLQKLTILSLLTSLPTYELEQPLSWKIQVYTEPKLSPHLQTGFGYSLDLTKWTNTRLIGLISAQLDASRVGIGPDLFFVHRQQGDFSIMLNYRGSWNNEDYKSIWNTQIGIPLSQQLELRVEHLRTESLNNEWQFRILKQFIL
ncbi:MAG: DUF4105 domain-containing protein [Pseudobdellovibrionaceae bacterium]